MIDDSPPDEIIEVTEDRWIVLAFAREWPRYAVEWSVRQRAGESDFPVVRGRVVREPERARSSDEIWGAARELAVAEANAALAQAADERPARGKGMLSRLFRR